jgi:hypothetical protein
MGSQKGQGLFYGLYHPLETPFTGHFRVWSALKNLRRAFFPSLEAFLRQFSSLQMPFSCLEKPQQPSKRLKRQLTPRAPLKEALGNPNAVQNSTQHHSKSPNAARNRTSASNACESCNKRNLRKVLAIEQREKRAYVQHARKRA